jgi:hypothetical protein
VPRAIIPIGGNSIVREGIAAIAKDFGVGGFMSKGYARAT